MSWRRFQTLLSGLVIYEQSGWRAVVENQETSGNSWSPEPRPTHSTIEEGERALLAAFSKVAGKPLTA